MKLISSRSTFPCHIALTLPFRAFKALYLCSEFLLIAFFLPATRSGLAKWMFNFKSIIMSKKTTQLPIKSVQTCSAQTATLCPAGSEVPTGLNAIVEQVLQNSNIGEADKAVIEIMFMYGLRISEVLAINSKSINSRNQIIIKGLKGSNDRLITPVIYSNYWRKVKMYNCQDHTLNGRFYYYRLFKKLGFTSSVVGNKKKSVTHSFRHNFVTEIMKETDNIEVAKELIGHKNSNSTKYYDDEQRKQSATKRSCSNKLIRYN